MTLKRGWVIVCAALLVTISKAAGREVGLDLSKMAGNSPVLISKFRSLRFRLHQHRQVSMKLSMSLRRVIYLQQNKQMLTSSVSMRYYWRDTAYAWNPQKHNGTYQISLPKELVWIPDIVLYNNIDRQVKDMTKNLLLTVRYTGDIVYRFPAVYRSTCPLKVSKYPFDEQTCEMVFGSWLHDNNTLDIDVTIRVPAIDVQSYRSNSMWLLVNMSARQIEPIYNVNGQYLTFPAVVFSVVLRRRWVMLCWYLLCPNAVTNLLTMMIHLLPCDSTEKVTMGVMLFLATVLYLMLLGDHLPGHGNVPLIVELVLSTIIMSCLSQTISIVVLHLHHNTKTRMPTWVRRLFLRYVARIVFVRPTERDVAIRDVFEMESSSSGGRGATKCEKCPGGEVDVDDGYIEGEDDLETNSGAGQNGTRHTLISQINKRLQEFEERSKRRLAKKLLRDEWKQVAVVIDRCMFYVYIITTGWLWKVFVDRIPIYMDPGVV